MNVIAVEVTLSLGGIPEDVKQRPTDARAMRIHLIIKALQLV